LDPALNKSLQALGYAISSREQNSLRTEKEEERESNTNRQALTKLCDWVKSCEAQPRRWHHYCDWPSRVLPEFFDLVGKRNDIALLILVHWCAILYSSPKPCVKLWAHRTAYHAIDELRSPGWWNDLLAWPLRALSRIQRQLPNAAVSIARSVARYPGALLLATES